MLLVANGIVEQPATELFRRHNHALFNFIAWQCHGNLQEAEDITQKTWVKLMTRCADYQPSARFRTYLFQIARNTLLDHHRSAAEQYRADWTEEDSEQYPDDDLTPEQALGIKQNLQQLRQAMFRLPWPQREVVVLRFFNDMTLEEIAHTIGEGFETVKSRLRYAFKRLRQELEALG